MSINYSHTNFAWYFINVKLPTICFSVLESTLSRIREGGVLEKTTLCRASLSKSMKMLNHPSLNISLRDTGNTNLADSRNNNNAVKINVMKINKRGSI